MKGFRKILSLLLAVVLLLGCVNIHATTVSATVDSYLAQCTAYASNMSIRTTQATSLMTYPCDAATQSGSAVASNVASGTKLTATALYQNTAGEYWYQVGSGRYVNAAHTKLVEHITSDVTVTGVISPACLGYGKGFNIGGTVSATINTLGTITAAMYKGTDLTQNPTISSSDTPTGQSYSLKGSTVDSNLIFSSLPKADYTYLLTADAVAYYVKDGVLTKSTKTVILEQKQCIINSTVTASGATAVGVDVSTWQPDIDWAKASQVVDFCIFRSSYSTNTDDQFYNNLNGCVTYGVPFGVYVYSHATTAAQVKVEAEHVLSLLKGYELDFPIFLDTEESYQASLPNSTKLEIVKAFVETVEAAGYEAGLYSSLSWFTSYYTDPYYDTIFKWVAQIYSSCQYTGGTRMWQYSWEGSFSGIPGNVDCNYYYGEMPVKSSGGTIKKAEPEDYRWETRSNVLTPTTDGGFTYNYPTLTAGSVSGGTYTDAQYTLDKTIMLNHDVPWEIEWKASGNSASVMPLSSSSSSFTSGMQYLYQRNGSTLIALGEYISGMTYHNYGLSPADYGIDVSLEHTYRLVNRINTDGSNMVYLFVDGKEIGPMNRYYIGGTYQGTTSNWVSGKDFRFSYIGNAEYYLSDFKLSYLQVKATGESFQPDEYRWETMSDGLVSAEGYTDNAANLVAGTCTNGSFSGAYFNLDKAAVLMHDRKWSVEWQSEGTWKDIANGTLLLSASNRKNGYYAPYLYRRTASELIAFGYHNGTAHQNYGICLSDHGIDGTAPHTYKLENRINADGSNMVYLLVDGVELGALNQYFVGGDSQGTTSNWISGKDFVFPYMGTPQFTIGNCTIDYIQVDEGVTKTGIVEFRDWNGTVLSSKEYTYGDTVVAPAAPTREPNESVSYYFAGWDKEIVPCEGDAVYTATYSTQYINYTVEFKNHDGTVLSSKTYHYGDTVTVPADPTRGDSGGYSYTFAGWDKAVTPCQGNATYTATYTATVIATIIPKYPSLSFEGEIFYNVYFATTGLDDIPLEDMGLITWNAANAEGTIENAGAIIPGAKLQGSYYCVRSSGIPAKNLGDTLYFKVYAKLADGSYIYSGLYNYSAKAYAKDRLANSTNEKMKALCVAMLNYGAAAQTYFAYRPYNLMNSDLTAAQKALVTAYSSNMVASVGSVSTTKAGGFVMKNNGFSKRYPSVSFEGAFSIKYYFTPANVPDNGMTLYYWDMATYNSVSVLTAANATGKLTMTDTGAGIYMATIDGIAAKELDSVIYVAGVYECNDYSYSTGVLPYSLGAYCVDRVANGSATMQAFAAATAVYGYYAKQYFA